MRADAQAGKLDVEAVEAVLAAAGHEVRRRREWPAGLTRREVEVLTKHRAKQEERFLRELQASSVLGSVTSLGPVELE